MSDARTLEDWQALSAEGLPAESHFLERNAEITRRYGQLFLRNSRVFKWAGLAYFASHRVGFAMRELSRLIEADIAGRSLRSRGFQNFDLELIRVTNNRVFHDIGWAHVAYERGGFAAVERAADAVDEMRQIVDAFRLIDASSSSPRRSADLWRAAELLARHEQREIVQKAFEQMSPHFALFLSLTTTLDFDGAEWNVDLSTFSSFYLFMFSAGLDVLISTRALPNVCRFDHRWCWVRRAVLTLWRGFDAMPPEIQRRLGGVRAESDPANQGRRDRGM